jgi:hypothetical protein
LERSKVVSRHEDLRPDSISRPKNSIAGVNPKRITGLVAGGIYIGCAVAVQVAQGKGLPSGLGQARPAERKMGDGGWSFSVKINSG